MNSSAMARTNPVDADFAHDVLEGLSRKQKIISSTWLYDVRGSELFEEITHLPEYYPTRSEIALLNVCAPQIADVVGAGAVVVELGSGSSRKTPLLLAALANPSLYVPIDISGEFLFSAVQNLARAFPALECLPLVADFSRRQALLDALSRLPAEGPRLGFFPGSTIGNFTPQAAVMLLRAFGDALGEGSVLAVGLDATRDPAILVPAYDDAAGITAAFNKNLLVRINRELEGDFVLGNFAHEARFDSSLSRIEMHLVSRCDQIVSVCGRPFAFSIGETIHTENSYKYSDAAFFEIAQLSGWTPVQTFVHAQSSFSIHLLRRAAPHCL